MGLAAFTSSAAVDDSTSSDDDSWFRHKSCRARGKRDLISSKTAKISSHVVWRQFCLTVN